MRDGYRKPERPRLQVLCELSFRFKEIICGMSETSGLPWSSSGWSTVELIAATALTFRSAGIAAWGDYVSETLVYGRNYDYLPWFKEFSKDIVIACYHPADGSLATATMGYAGEI